MATSPLILLSDADAGWGTIAYNAHAFSGLRKFSLRSDPVWDDYRRTIVASIFTMQIRAYQTYSDVAAAETGIQTLRRKLNRPGGSLTVSGLGLGTLNVNTGMRDLDWGPRPGPIQMEAMGATVEIMFDLTWQVCDAATVPETSIKAFGHEVEWSFDEADVQTRSITGYVEVAGNRSGSTGQPSFSTADVYREQIKCQVPTGFRRAARRFKLSGDLKRLDFSFVDQQLDADVPPEHCIRADVDFEYENVPPGFAQWSATLGGTIELPTHTPPVRAAEAFLKIYLDKQQKMRKAVEGKGFVMPTRIRFSRALGSRRSSFGAAWMVTGCLDDLISKGGLWEPLDGATWAKWAASLEIPWSNRGSGKLLFNRADGALVSLVDGSSIPPIGTGGGAGEFPQTTGQGLFSVEPIPLNLSWIWFENTLEAQRDHNAVTHTPSVKYKPPAPAENGPLETRVGVTMAQTVGEPLTQVTQYQAPPTDLVLMTGKCLRAEHLPAIPRLASIQGKQVQEVKVRIEGPKPFACFFGKTVYMARWAILYRLLNGYITETEPQENPTLCCPTKPGTTPTK